MTAHAILESVADILRPPRRIPVAEAAARYLQIHRPGGESGGWNPALTPYMLEPMNRLADRTVEAVIFVGPARTGKTAALVLGWLTYAVCCDPGDFLFLNTSEATARDFSKDDVARAHRHSPELKNRLSPYASDDNVFDKQYRHGMRLMIGWPSINQLSGRTLRYVSITDYDRITDNIDGEGDPFTLASKRVQTFLSGGRVCVESSPGWLIDDPKWQYRDPHEGPPCKGIFALYNQGDRRRWYWPCPECGAYFTAAPSPEALVEVDGEARLICPHCGAAMGREQKKAMNAAGIWLAAGQTIDSAGVISGEPPKTKIASYWLTGPAAAYQSWDSLLRKARAAQEELEKTGAEDRLQAVLTGDFGMAYRPRQLHVTRDPRALQDRAEDRQKRTVPEGVYFLTAAVDVQNNRFVVQVVGWGRDNERWLVDRYNLRWSRRLAGNDEPEPIDPAGHIEDWQVLIDQVLRKPYPLETDESRGVVPAMLAVDSGGKAGVTERAYLFWRQARQAGYAQKLMLVKGSSRPDGPRITRTYPDATQRKDRKANARGEIPVWQLNTLVLKDSLAADLERAEAGPGYLHFPKWLGTWFFDELTAETRTQKGWQNLGNARNEAMDLMVYNHAAMLMLKAERLNWDAPPAWADPQQNRVALTGGALPATGKAPPSPAPAIPRVSVRPRDEWGL
ncbi:MAG TPA: phage terminase large subunit family protein [Candidatus Competibacteraceae bacterium]|nr:phage terminase large subunit family protein [Candidatus Competibacteraceae bacterium]